MSLSVKINQIKYNQENHQTQMDNTDNTDKWITPYTHEAYIGHLTKFLLCANEEAT